MAKRRAVGFLINALVLSEKRSCRIVGLSRSVQQYCPASKNDVPWSAALRSWSRRTGAMAISGCPRCSRREGLVANRKRTYRLYTEQGLQVRTKKRRKLPRRDRIAPQVPAAADAALVARLRQRSAGRLPPLPGAEHRRRPQPLLPRPDRRRLDLRRAGRAPSRRPGAAPQQDQPNQEQDITTIRLG